MTALDPEGREEILAIASRITPDRADAGAVVLTAAPMLAWLEGSLDQEDQVRRLKALRRYDTNLSCARSREPGEAFPADGQPEVFVLAAITLYAFAVDATLPRCPDYLEES